MKMTIFSSDVKQDSKNCLYKKKNEVKSLKQLEAVVSFDHVCAEFKNSYRAKENFLRSDCDVFDCDNDNSDNPNDWIYPKDYKDILGDVSFAIVPSRNNMKEKGGKSARPRHHIYIPHKPFYSAKECEDFKRLVYENFKFLDKNALDAARFIYGCDVNGILWNEGKQLYDPSDLFAELESLSEKITEGSRNTTMSRIAGKLVKRYGVTEEARRVFDELSLKCEPPLENDELNKIWRSASKFGKMVTSQEGYIPPEKYNQELALMPEDLTDLGQANMLSEEYRDILRYSSSTDYLVYNGSIWEESKSKAQGIAHKLTERQLEEADIEIKKCTEEMNKNGALSLLATLGKNKALAQFTPEQRRSYDKCEIANTYKKFALKRRDSKYIWSALKEIKPLIEIDVSKLDTNELLLNTPSKTYNLKSGKEQEHKAENFITKQTTVDPSSDNEALWHDALNTFFSGNKDLIDYVQKIVGLSAIGKVYVEALIIAYGEGRNGKSTFWNTIARVLGTYSGTMSADILTAGCRRNAKPELAEAKGKRLLIAAELEEGMRMSTSNVKQLCSTDEIIAEKKYKSPFKYTPSHTLVLYTNHLPKVGAIDKGTWRRLIVIPFNAKIEGNSDIKNYSDYLYNKAGGSILKWIIDGAKKVIADNYKIKKPEIVKKSIDKYQEENDWFNSFINERCEVGKDLREKSGEFYTEYRNFSLSRGEYVRSTADFYAAIENEGYLRHRTNKGTFIYGVKLKSDFEN